MAGEQDEPGHTRKMQRRKALVDARIAKATEERGVLIINTGNGKGKSSASFGMLARALGHNMRAGVVQFIKGAFSTGEEAFFRRFPEVSYYVMGEGFTWETQDRARDVAAARAAWAKACAMLEDPAFELVILDELNIVLKYEYLSVEEVVAKLSARPAMQHVVVTGRHAPQALMDIADTVTNMQAVKHAFEAGVRAQKGVEL
ncbi:MAG: cob(I)yrinic acid a,c-diamide adenosyltransferase [Alphaproteobacteria bacterium]|nr:cob(I)yrinic acid a,c-diamide adenosyltransferase [Alphaproteobacteria bacterium]